MPVQRLLVVGVRVAEQLVEPGDELGGRRDQPVVVIVPDLVAEVAQQGAVRLVHLHPQLLAVHVVTLGEIDCDDPVFVPGHHLLVCAGQQPESQAVIGILIASDDRQLQLVQFDDQPTLGRLGAGELRKARRCRRRWAVRWSAGRTRTEPAGIESVPANCIRRHTDWRTSSYSLALTKPAWSASSPVVITSRAISASEKPSALPHARHAEFSNVRR